MSLGHSSSASALTRGSFGYRFGTLEERLLHEADRKRENRERLKREKELNEMRECSFQPNTNANASFSARRNSAAMVNRHKYNSTAPIHERVDQI